MNESGGASAGAGAAAPGGGAAFLVLLHALFVLSGLTALVYEVLWLRGFAIVLGSTLESMSCVLTAFMLGLALGSGLAARALRGRALTRGQCLAIYGVLELVIGVYGLVFTASLFLAQDAWLSLAGALGSESHAVGRVAGHFVIGVVTVLVPTACMGATLPVLSMAVERGADTSGLYGANTLGAAAGSVLASFVLIYNFGCLVSAAVVASVNAALFVACLVASRAPRLAAPATATDEVPATDAQGPALGGRAVLALAFVSGYAFFGFELVWNRCLGLILGNRVYVTSVTLGLVLLCLGIGARLARVVALRQGTAAGALAASWGVAAASTAAALWLAPAALIGGGHGGQSMAGDPAARLLLIALLVVVPATALGVGFPLLLALPVREGGRGAHVGRLYATNTLGSVAGTLLTGYGLLALLGSGRVLVLTAVLLVVGALALVRITAPRRAAAATLVLVLVGLATASRWGTIIAVVDPATAVVLEEDRHGVFSITPVASGHLSVRCDATELVFRYGHPVTQLVQESQAHAPIAFAPGRRRVAVIGSGYGITAGAFSTWKDVERIDAVEILPLIVRHADRFSPGNHDYHRQPGRVVVHVTDGRHFLALQDELYDIISINVSDPYLPGSSSLFSREFYALAASKLAPDGIVAQHVFGPDSPSLLAGFRREFPHVRAVCGYRNSVTLIGARRPLAPLHAAEFDAHPQVRRVLAGAGRPDATLADLLAEGDARLAELEAAPVVFENSDVFPALEFRRSAELDTFFSNR